MSQQPVENSDQPGTPNPEHQSNGHPAWQEILDTIPDPGLQELIKPKLEEWDKGVQQKLQQVREPYEPYQELVKNEIPKEEIEQALWIAHMFNTNPQEIVQKAIENFNLDFVPKGQVQQQQVSSSHDLDDEDEDYEDNSSSLSGLENHPAFKAMMEKVEQANQILTQQQQKEQQEQEQTEFEQYLENLHKGENGETVEFDDLYVASLMQQGMDANDAIQSYQNLIKAGVEKATGGQQQQQQAPPVVMGGNSGSGTGIPANDVNMGKMNRGSVNDLAIEFLQKNLSNTD